MKKTALEWFMSEFQKEVIFEPESELDIWIKDLIPRAIKMEEEQILDALNFGYMDGIKEKKTFKNSIEYYNSIFKK